MYEELYTHLFNAVTDALAALNARDAAGAGSILKAAQQWSEERFISEENPSLDKSKSQ